MNQLKFVKYVCCLFILVLCLSAAAAQPSHKQKEIYDAILETQDIVKYLDQWEGKTSQGLPPLIKTKSFTPKEVAGISHDEAVQWYTKLAQSGNSYAQCVLGYYYENLEYSRDNVLTAFSWYTKASKNSYAPGDYLLSYCAYTHKALMENSEIKNLAKKASDQGFPPAQYFYSILLYYDYSNPGIEQAIMDLQEKAASSGYRDAYMSLANLYRYSYSIENGEEKASFYEQKAIQENDPGAYRSLAVNYNYGYSNYEINLPMALEYYLKAAESGDTYSMEDASLFYRGYYDTLQYNQEKAAYWFEKAAETRFLEDEKLQKKNAVIFSALQKKAAEGSPTAMIDLASAYSYGYGTPVDEEQARYWFEKACALTKDFDPQYYLAHYYNTGSGGKKDLKKAVYWFKQSDTQQDYSKGAICYIYNAVLGIQDFYREIKAEDYYSSQNDNKILPMYVKDISKEEAFTWYKEQADKDDFICQTVTGFCYETGLGTAKNESQAYVYYTKASDADFLPARYALALLYESGRGVKKDTAKAYTLFLECAESVYEKAYLKAASMYLLGEGVKRSSEQSTYYADEAEYYDVKSISFYTDTEVFDRLESYTNLYNASLSGKAEDLYNLAQFLDNETDYYQVFLLYEKASQQNYVPAVSSLAYCYEIGSGVKQDVNKAFDLYSKAAELGSNEALYALGYFYWTGMLGKRDKDKAVSFFEKAAENGNSEAEMYLVQITGAQEESSDDYYDDYDYYDDDYYGDDYYDDGGYYDDDYYNDSDYYYDDYYDEEYEDYYDDYTSYEDYETSIAELGKRVTISSGESSLYTAFQNNAESIVCFFFSSFLRGDTEWKKVCDKGDTDYFAETYASSYSSDSGITVLSYDIFPDTLVDTGANYYEMTIGLSYQYGDETFSGTRTIEVYKNRGLWQIWDIPE